MEVILVLICSAVSIYLILCTSFIITTIITILGNPLGNHSYPWHEGGPTFESGGGFNVAAAPPATPITTVQAINYHVNQVYRRPRRAAATGVSILMRSLESSQAKRQREEREAHLTATLAAADAQLETQRDTLRQAELEKAIEAE